MLSRGEWVRPQTSLFGYLLSLSGLPWAIHNANYLQGETFWFTSNAWNFPLNTITTLAELYIGFLVAAAANRSERALRKMIEHTKQTVDRVEEINSKQNEILKLLVDYQKKELQTESEVLKEVQSLKK